MSGTTWTILLVVEGPSDATRLPVLVDRWIGQELEWADLPSFRQYTDLEGNPGFLPVKTIPRLARDLKLPPFRSVPGEGGDTESLRKLRQILKVRKVSARGDTVILWGRDVDDRPERLQEAQTTAQDLPLLCAVARRSGEAWVVLGWEPGTPGEWQQAEALRAEMTFDPVQQPDRLSPKRPEDPECWRFGKHLVEVLTGGDPDRERSCLERAADITDARSTATNLDAFRDSVRRWLRAG